MAQSSSTNQEQPRVHKPPVSTLNSVHDIASSPPLSAYVHIPFCRRRCHYCDFPIVTVGARDPSVHERLRLKMENYVNLVIREIKASSSPPRPHSPHAPPHSPHSPLRTIHFGGGTPSLLPPDLLARLVDTLRQTYGLAPDAEICLEADPGTFDEARLRAWVEGSGVTRLSVGCQAFDQDLLKACGRSHSLADVYDAVDAVKRVGLQNWSLDLISGLPGQTLDSWRHSLTEVIRLGPSHVSVYDLQVEQGTAFARWYSPGCSPLPADDLSAEMYREASRQLREAGYVHYEVSNYAKPGFQSRHNRTYWTNFPYLGFGLGAASYVARKRFVRPRTWDGYGEWVGKYEASNGVIDWPEDSREEELLDTVMLGLRLGEGLGMPELAGRFGAEAAAAVGKALQKFVNAGLVETVQVMPDGSMEVLGAGKQCVGVLEQQLDAIVAQEIWDAQHGRVRESGERTRVVEGHSGKRGIEGGESAGAGGDDGEVILQGLRMRLTDPEGFLVSNDVISSVFEAIG
ncbi:unnamed protein product [Closterium sp. Yama58-4]|nr:unnamed protein product [Closterium sp. Yama58-4]